MSQESSIGSLNNINDEDSRLVESILNDLNGSDNSSGPPPQMQGQMQGQKQEPSPEQIKAMQMQRQMAMQQQQQQIMAQQQQMAQQQRESQQKIEKENVIKSDTNSLIDNIKKEAKSIILIVVLSFIMNLDQVDKIFKMAPSIFVGENGGVNVQGVLVKSLLIGLIFYLVKSYLL